jgi:hypothetical protein
MKLSKLMLILGAINMCNAVASTMTQAMPKASVAAPAVAPVVTPVPSPKAPDVPVVIDSVLPPEHFRLSQAASYVLESMAGSLTGMKQEEIYAANRAIKEARKLTMSSRNSEAELVMTAIASAQIPYMLSAWKNLKMMLSETDSFYKSAKMALDYAATLTPSSSIAEISTALTGIMWYTSLCEAQASQNTLWLWATIAFFLGMVPAFIIGYLIWNTRGNKKKQNMM